MELQDDYGWIKHEVSIIYTWLVKTLHNVLSSFVLSLVLVLPSKLLLYLDFSFSMLQTVGCVLYSILQNAYVAEDQPRFPTCPPLSRSAVLPCPPSQAATLGIPVLCQYTWHMSSVTYEFRNVCNWHSWVWQTWTYVRTYIRTYIRTLRE